MTVTTSFIGSAATSGELEPVIAKSQAASDLWPQVPLLPADAAGKARVRSLAQIAIADVHPLIVPRVRNFLERECGVDEATRLKWVQHWFDQGTQALEARLTDGQAGLFCHGDEISLADLALASHVVGARLFSCDLTGAPRLTGVVERCMKQEAFARAHPLAQPGARPMQPSASTQQ
jgi:maleylacetoacetate isomerase